MESYRWQQHHLEFGCSKSPVISRKHLNDRLTSSTRKDISNRQKMSDMSLGKAQIPAYETRSC